jgi:tetratricopeptide (TPR) repeat protein
LVVSPFARAAGDVGSLMRQGNSLYGRGKFDEALSRYGMAELLEPDATGIRFNKASALYRLGRYEDALRELELASIDKKPARRAAALYNTGNVLFKAGQLDGAIKAYTAALVVNPKDRQAKENLEYCLRKKEEQQQQQNQDQQQQQNQQQQSQQQPQPQPQQQQQQQGMSKDQAERVLQAVQNKEKDQQERTRQAGGRRQVERDW